MKFFTLDRLGYIKNIEFNKRTAKPAPSKKLLKKIKKPEDGQEVEKVDRLCVSGIDESILHVFLKSASELILVTASNRIFCFDLKENKTWCLNHDGEGQFKEKVDKDGSLLASFSKNILITCTSNGLLTSFDLNDGENVKATRGSLGQDKLVALAIHPQFPHIFATGGDERELCIWDITKLDEETNKIEPIWKSKNVPNDSLDMRVKVHITTIVWMSQMNYTEIAIGSAHNQIRIYDTSKKRRPILDFQKCGSHPIKALVFTRNNEFVFSDTLGNVSAINASTGQLTGRFKGIAGAVVDLYACQNHPYLVTVSLDRRLRVFEEIGQRRIVKDIYLKQHLVKVVVDEELGSDDENEKVQAGYDNSNEDEEDNIDVWDKLPEVGEEYIAGEKRKIQ